MRNDEHLRRATTHLGHYCSVVKKTHIIVKTTHLIKSDTKYTYNHMRT